jgi:excisionase family DNA binding protein
MKTHADRKPAEIDHSDRIALRVSDAVAATSIGRTTVYAAIKAGHLRSFRLHGRRLIMKDDLTAWLIAARDRDTS